MKKIMLLAALAVLTMGCQESLEDKCYREAKAFTAKKCPARLEENIIIDSLTFERATHTLHYYYRLTGVADREGAVDKDEATEMLKKGLKNTTDMKVYKDNGYNFTYTYRSEKDPDKIWLEVVLTEKDY